MRRVLAGAAVFGLALVLTGCGGKSARERVSAYFQQVNSIQQSMANQISAADIAFRRFLVRGVTPKVLHDLERAEGTIRLLHARLAKLDPPKQAQAIHRDLLRLVSLQATLASDVMRLAAYQQKLDRLLALVTGDGKRLQAELKTKSAKVQSQSFKTYAAALTRNAERLAALVAPAVALPSQHAEASRLEQTIRISRRISQALRPIPPPTRLSRAEARNKRALAKYNREALAYKHAMRLRKERLSFLLSLLRDVSSPAQRRRARAEQAQAVRAFDARLAAIGKLATRIQNERLDLERKL